MRSWPLWMGVVCSVVGCRQDATFTKLAELDPSARDTSAPPIEVPEADTSDVPDPECPGAIYAAQETTRRDDCQTPPPVVRYAPVVEWQMTEWDAHPTSNDFVAGPVVGQLTDDDGDGRVSSSDVPDIVTISFTRSDSQMSVLRLISGDGSGVHWSRWGWTVEGRTLRTLVGATPALGDADSDGQPEIYIVLGPSDEDDPADFQRSYRHQGQADCFLARLDANGDIEQLNADHPVTCLPHMPSLADVDADGTVDVVVANEVFRTSDLALVATPQTDSRSALGIGHDASYWMGGTPVVADLDGDGVLELITGRHIQEADGTVRCFTGDSDGWPAVADLDGDGDGEVVISGAGRVNVFDHQCGIIDAWPLDADGRGGPPTIADYDGDGDPEMGFAAGDRYVVYEVDGTLKWTSPATDDSSNCTGSSVFDFEEDGYAEVVYADEEDLWVISGHSGELVMRWSGHASETANEYPIVVDVDGDGEAEIVTVGASGVTVLAAEQPWSSARPVWNQHAYGITNVRDDLTIPSPTPQNWPDYNSFRSGDLRVNAGQGARRVDATPFVHRVCDLECGAGSIQVAVSPSNEGLADAVEGIDLAVYAEQADSSRRLLFALSAEDLHRAGYTTEGMVLDVSVDDLPTGTLILVADDDGTGQGRIEECDESNNELRLEGLCDAR